MCKVILFGGTTEGRILAEHLSANGIETLVCVATEYGEQVLSAKPPVHVHTGRLGAAQIRTLLQREQPRLVLDATHPYAASISKNLSEVCAALGLHTIRIKRKSLSIDGCTLFSDMDGLVNWLNTTQGVIFSAMGVKEAESLTAVAGYRERVFLRLLPSAEGICECAKLGYSMKHLCCMQGPFSLALNKALFMETKARILVTKESGQAGGFMEKVEAAKQCGMAVGVLARPGESRGISVEQAKQRIAEAFL